MAAVITSGLSRARYFFTASLNNWLCDFFMYRASLSAGWKTSSGIEIAVFTQLLYLHHKVVFTPHANANGLHLLARRPIANRPQDSILPHKAASRKRKPATEEADQGVGRGPGGPPHKIVPGREGLRV